MEPDDLLSDAAVNAAVGALAARNQHHLASMTPEEQQEALGHWRALAMDVLVAARAASGGEQPPPAEGGPGRAVIVLEDVGDEDVSVHVTFHPELEDLGGDQVAGTPAQITAVALLEQFGDGGEEPGGGPLA